MRKHFTLLFESSSRFAYVFMTVTLSRRSNRWFLWLRGAMLHQAIYFDIFKPWLLILSKFYWKRKGRRETVTNDCSRRHMCWNVNHLSKLCSISGRLITAHRRHSSQDSHMPQDSACLSWSHQQQFSRHNCPQSSLAYFTKSSKCTSLLSCRRYVRCTVEWVFVIRSKKQS